MLVEQAKGETDHCRHRLMKYCRGQGLDLGCGATRIRTDAIGIDLNHPLADMRTDARLLEQYPDKHFDYIFSSHLLEEIEDTESTLREWLRIIKDGGYMVLYQADKELYYPLGHPDCNTLHKHHYSWKELWDIFKRIEGTKLIHHWRDPKSKEWSFELVVQKIGENMTDDTLKEREGISLLIPTLKRPFGMEELTASVNHTANYPDNIEIIFGVHEDDIPSIEKSKELKPKYKIDIRHEFIKRYTDGHAHLSYLWNQIYEKSKHPILGYFGDDVIFHTPGWDDEVRKEFVKDRHIMVACNDVHVQRGKIATLFFTHRTVHEKVGFYLCMKLRRWYTDTFWDVIFKMAGKFHYREDLVMEHLHPDVFPEKLDSTYTSMEHLKDPDKRIWTTPGLRQEMKNIAGTIIQMSKKNG